ncbi:MAG: iron-sulfur cluster repair di-iron protein [bacterium]|jgi:regulator of cell morphogenesis and NO signaling
MTRETTVRDIAIAVPASVRVFEKYQIDFCCNGRRPLRAACLDAGVSPADLLAEISDASACEAAPATDWSTAPVSELAAHVVERHHAYLERELPQIEARLNKVVANHSATRPWLAELRTVFFELCDELRAHLRKEEEVLFPYLKALEAGEPASLCFASVAVPVRVMLSEHSRAGAMLAQMRRLSDGYAAPEDGCPGFRALMHDLAALERDLHQHIHLENNILFPRAIELDTQARTRD